MAFLQLEQHSILHMLPALHLVMYVMCACDSHWYGSKNQGTCAHGQVGSGKTALETLLHEGGHAGENFC